MKKAERTRVRRGMERRGSRREVVRTSAQWRMKGKMLSLNEVKETRDRRKRGYRLYVKKKRS